MGKIKHLFAGEHLETRSRTPNNLWVDLCENIHIHYRNFRLEFSPEEWGHFSKAAAQMSVLVPELIAKYEWEPGDHDFLVSAVYQKELKADSDYFKNRCTIELQADNTVHFHYRDLRVDWTKEEFYQIAKMFREAAQQYEDGIKHIQFSNAIPELVKDVDIERIKPYDEGHKPLEEDEDHREGIEYCKQLIMEGKKLRPILVNNEGYRLDGFKRYIAQKELGYKKIDVIVDPQGKMGGQHGLSMTIEEEDNGENARSK